MDDAVHHGRHQHPRRPAQQCPAPGQLGCGRQPLLPALNPEPATVEVGDGVPRQQAKLLAHFC